MKQTLRKLCWPLLRRLEQGDNASNYQPSHRYILVAVGVLFILLAAAALYVALISAQWAGVLPVIIFGGVGLFCLVVGFLGSNAAVARLWGLK